MRRDIRQEAREIDSEVAGKTLCTAFQATVEARAEQPALKWRTESGWNQLTWHEYRRQVAMVTTGVRALGFHPGEFGLIMARNRPEHLVADLAFLHAGGTPVSIYNTLAPEQIAYVANHCEATFAVVEDEGFLAKFKQAWPQLPHLRRVILLEGEGDGERVVEWRRLLEAGASPDGSFEESWRRVAPSHLASLVYTSGTTGPPKAVMYSHHNVLWTVESSRRWRDIQPGERLLSYLPYAHVAERIFSHWGGLVHGAVIHFCPDPAALLPHLLETRPTAFVGVPRVWEKLHAGIRAGLGAESDEQRREAVAGVIEAGRRLARASRSDAEAPEMAATAAAIAPVQAAIRAKVGLDQCQIAITSTAPIAEEVQEFFYAIGLPLVEVWGQSELTGPATANPVDAIKIGTVGPTIPGVEARLDSDGEIQCRGGNVMVGYYRDPEKTAEAMTADGWLRTGDVATVDEDGYYRIVDRKKELIITSYGKNISPANLESLLKQHPLIGQACVIGDRRPYVTALIVLDHEVAPLWAARQGISATSPEALAADPRVEAEVDRAVAETNRHVSQVEQIKRHVILPGEWTAESEELTPTLKLKRRVVTEKYAAQIEAMYAEKAREEPAPA